MTITESGPPPMAELPPLSDDRLYTAEEAAQYVSVSARFLKRGASADSIQHRYVGKFPRWSAQNIRDIVAGVPHRPRPSRQR
jgi:hypothetical protein